MFLLVDKGFLLFSFHALAAAFDWVLVLAHQVKTFGKEGFFGRLALAAIKQTVLAIIIFWIFGNTENGLFKNFFNRLYRLSPFLNV